MARAWFETRTKRYKPTAAGTTPLYKIAKGQVVRGVYARVDVARVAGTSVEVGDAADPDGYFAEATLASTVTGRKVGKGAYLTEEGGKVYDTATAVNAVLTGTPTTMPDIVFEILILNTSLK